jgi:ribosome-binding ATPase YchF (GTP1/OBG family)
VDVGIVGAPGGGRTTVFRALLAHRAPREAGSRQSAGTVGAIHVQDPRLDRLSRWFKPQKTTPIEIRVHDLCQSLEPSFPTSELEAMKRMDLLLLVIPAFSEPSPQASNAQLERLLGELCFEDLALVDRRLKTASRDRLPDATREALERVHAVLEEERPARQAELAAKHLEPLRAYNLVTARAMLAVRNVAEDEAAAPTPASFAEHAAARGMPTLSLCAALEAEMAELPAEERAAFLAEYGVSEPAGAALTRAVLQSGDIIPFFTVGEDECRAWPIARGTTARKAAGKIHSDIERGFIRAEVVGFVELEELDGSLAEARKRGTLRLEGKDYVVQDGEVVHFRFNV